MRLGNPRHSHYTFSSHHPCQICALHDRSLGRHRCSYFQWSPQSVRQPFQTLTSPCVHQAKLCLVGWWLLLRQSLVRFAPGSRKSIKKPLNEWLLSLLIKALLVSLFAEIHLLFQIASCSSGIKMHVRLHKKPAKQKEFDWRWQLNFEDCRWCPHGHLQLAPEL